MAIEEVVRTRRFIVRIMQLPHGLFLHKELEDEHEERNVFQPAGQLVMIQYVNHTLVHAIHHRYQDQSKEGSEDQTEHHGPCQWSPECNVITSKEYMRIKLCEQGRKIDIQANCQRYQAEDGGNGGEQYRRHTCSAGFHHCFVDMHALLYQQVRELYQYDAVTGNDTGQRHDTHTCHYD